MDKQDDMLLNQFKYFFYYLYKLLKIFLLQFFIMFNNFRKALFDFKLLQAFLKI